MPHVTIQYTANLDADTDVPLLCRELAAALVGLQDEEGRQVFPIGGTRVLAYPAQHFAVADGKGDYAFVYVNVRIAGGRTEAVKQRAGEALLDKIKSHFEALMASRLIGITLQIDEGAGQVFDAKHSNLQPLFKK